MKLNAIFGTPGIGKTESIKRMLRSTDKRVVVISTESQDYAATVTAVGGFIARSPVDLENSFAKIILCQVGAYGPISGWMSYAVKYLEAACVLAKEGRIDEIYFDDAFNLPFCADVKQFLNTCPDKTKLTLVTQGNLHDREWRELIREMDNVTVFKVSPADRDVLSIELKVDEKELVLPDGSSESVTIKNEGEKI